MIENGGKLALLKAARAAMKAEGERERNLRRGESRLAEPSEDSSEEF
jgi:hypothetical protein